MKIPFAFRLMWAGSPKSNCSVKTSGFPAIDYSAIYWTFPAPWAGFTALGDDVDKAPPPRPERCTEQISIRTLPSTRAKIESLAKAEGISLAELVERAIKIYAPSSGADDDQ